MTLPETSTPIVASAFVVGIGLLGIVAGIVACRRVFAEGKILDKGEDALTGSLPSSDLDSTDPVTWLASNNIPKDSHFGDHLLSVWCGWLGERVPTLAELHGLSARRERRRLSARISGGITALLLICGIAGTLLCIHPILKAFTIPVNADKEVVIDPMVAQKLIRNLGSAFLPSLAALGFTVLVAILRGMYLQTTTGLAWRLDKFAVAQLFPRFKPKRFGAELTEVHLKLSRLADRMEERDRNFSEVVGILGKAALDLKESGPKLKAASDRMSDAAERLANETESMTKSLDTHLGESSILSKGTYSIKEILGTCVDTAKQLQEGGTTLAKSLAEAFGRFEIARTELGTSVAGIPKQIQQGFDVGGKTLIDASGNLEQARSNLASTVAGIPQQIQQGCDSGSKTLIDANLQAAKGTIASIAKATESAATVIKSAAGDVRKDIQTTYTNAGETFTRAASDASNYAAKAIGQAAGAATKGIREEVEPVTAVVAEMRKQLDAANTSYANAGKVFTRAATEASNHAAAVIGQAASEAVKRIKAGASPVIHATPGGREPLDTGWGSADAGRVIIPANIATSNQTTTAIGQAKAEIPTSIKAEVESIAQVSTERRPLDATNPGNTEIRNEKWDGDRRTVMEAPPKPTRMKRALSIVTFGLIK